MMNMTAFFIGVATTFFATFSIYILWWRRNRSRFQTILGTIMTIWCLWCLKDLVLTFPGMYTEQVLNWIMVVDGWSALTYMMLICEVVMPRRMTWRRLSLAAVPFLVFTVGYAVWPETWVIYAYAFFLWCFAWAIVIVGYVKMKRRLAYIYDNYSNIDRIDVSWLRPVFVFSVVGQLLWLGISLWASPVGDVVYYLSVVALWLMVLYYSWDFRPIMVSEDRLAPGGQKPLPPINEGELERLMDQQRLYLKRDLTLADLAQALDTNRTYVSKYLSQVLGLTFYDYINQLRIERVSIPMMREHPEFKLDFVARESGFASISTFRRAFIKLTGQMPSQFEASES